ncbi:MAG: hypothetical protein NUV74_13085 [Candidatus Brocadiaceae bacterium]|nr:hypothetical protein [Candidatus Brocadiaceae bacterium]
MKHMESGKKKLKERGIYKMDINKIKYVVCINNEGYQASLELHKLYQVIPDKTIEDDGDIRIIDESGEDYIYPAFYFKKVSLTKDVKSSLLKAS